MTERDPAAARWAVLQVVRAVGVVTFLVGLLHESGRIPLLEGVPQWFGYVLMAIGLFESFYLPLLLARRWKSPLQ